MLKRLEPNPRQTFTSIPFDERLHRLVKLAQEGKSLEAGVLEIANSLGFDSFMYATANYHLRPDNDERMYVFTTLPRDWVIRYDQCAYVECDPRVVASFDNALPLLWDQVSERNRNARTDAFLEDAAAHGVASGIAFVASSVSSWTSERGSRRPTGSDRPRRDARSCWTVTAHSCATSPTTATRRRCASSTMPSRHWLWPAPRVFASRW